MATDPVIAAAALAYVMETAPVLALQLDADRRVVSANAQAMRVLGPDAVGRTLAELVVDFTRVPDGGSDGVQLLALKTAAGVPESFQFRCFALPAGTLALGSLDFPEQAHLRHAVLGLNRELNDLTRQLHLANAELRELNQLKNQFLGMAAHDLRKPLGVIMTYLEFVLDEAGAQLTAQHREFLRTGLAAATGMKRLIDNFLDVAIIESGKLRLDLALASVPEILAGAVPIVRLVAEKKKVTLLVDAASDARRLRVDASKLQQVLLNLVGNAVEHSVAGQRVWLSARWDDTQLVFAVRDEGSGIAPEDQARLFSAFARAGTRKTAGERSVGLGLTIARLVVEAHGGRLWVESEPGHGATFFAALPIQPSTQGAPHP
ncbi:MAG: HAMP domain-containing sensor histidine kinase [Verrucomicrobia bacterium]|nr:HAMP domain-containing sensor histidine kinase [Verrucomicrobiota bacterium]